MASVCAVSVRMCVCVCQEGPGRGKGVVRIFICYKSSECDEMLNRRSSVTCKLQENCTCPAF